MVVRREEDGIKRYVHLGTGNYNDATAKLYTDMGILTCNESIDNTNFPVSYHTGKVELVINL